MKQKKFFLTLAASMMLAAGFTSCDKVDSPVLPEPEPEPQPLPEVVDDFDQGSLIKNGSCQGSLDANFWCHEWRTADAQFDGNALIVEDPADPTNRCAAVVCRSTEEAQAAGNMIADGDHIAGWDSQFFITFGEDQALKAGDKLKLKMRIKADVEQSGVSTQCHNAPGGYMHWYCVGDVNFTTEWVDFVSNEIEVVEGAGWAQAAAGMYTIAFNLSNGQHNVFYFDDMQVIVTRAQ